MAAFVVFVPSRVVNKFRVSADTASDAADKVLRWQGELVTTGVTLVQSIGDNRLYTEEISVVSEADSADAIPFTTVVTVAQPIDNSNVLNRINDKY